MLVEHILHCPDVFAKLTVGQLIIECRGLFTCRLLSHPNRLAHKPVKHGPTVRLEEPCQLRDP